MDISERQLAEAAPEQAVEEQAVVADDVVQEHNEQGETHSFEQAEGDAGSQLHEQAGTTVPHLPLEPPADCVPVTKDGGVLKKVVQEGTGDEPPLHARCIVHYVGWLCSRGEVFMDTHQETESGEPKRIVAGRDSSAQETGLCLAVAKMRAGEKAWVYVVDPKYGYGERGSFSFPCVPPNSQLVYEVELLGFEPVEEDDDERPGLLYEERLEKAERKRLQGNQLFQEGKYKEALNKYAVALSYLDEDFMMQLDGPYLDKAEAIKVPIHLNMAAVQLKTGDNNTAIYNCTQVLGIERENVKALFRRGRARHLLGQTEEALSDLEAAYKLDPSDKAILTELHALKQTMKRERVAQAELFKGKLGAAPPPATASASQAGGSSSGADDDHYQYDDDPNRQQGAATTSSREQGAATANGSKSQRPQQQAKAGAAAASGSGSGGGSAGRGLVSRLLGLLQSLFTGFFTLLLGRSKAAVPQSRT